ncbi:GGDEF domain-containing protein [Thalassotalea crassostreae]|uniref:GGDEF domain-containing protein n=1 Tax=Thalassotalea crassostreae TaxID=1763536 RepID=UPI0008A1CDA7|nr:GGDEF domain-containing protein [Thalassotalea crassostreae]
MLNTIISSGTKFQSFDATSRIKAANIVSIITVAISAFYSLLYLFYFQDLLVGSLNLVFTLAYTLGPLIMSRNAITLAKIWFFVVLLLHLWVCTNVYLTNDSGFHLFYFLVPTGVFLLLDLNQYKEKWLLTISAIVLFFYCENSLNTAPLITLNEEVNHFLYQSVILLIMLEVIVVLTLFNKQIEKTQAILEKQASTDFLTGCFNRNYFFQQANLQLSYSKQQQRPFSVILINIDNLGFINDNHGYDAADMFLCELVGLIQTSIQDDQLMARIGGNEFVISLPENTLQEAQKLVNKLQTIVDKKTFADSNGINIDLQYRLGVATNKHEDDSLMTLLSRADSRVKQQARHSPSVVASV